MEATLGSRQKAKLALGIWRSSCSKNPPLPQTLLLRVHLRRAEVTWEMWQAQVPQGKAHLGIECTLGCSPLKAAWFQFVLR